MTLATPRCGPVPQDQARLGNYTTHTSNTLVLAGIAKLNSHPRERRVHDDAVVCRRHGLDAVHLVEIGKGRLRTRALWLAL